MNDENNKYLNDKYSDIIRKFQYNGKQLPFWFECGDGWLSIIDNLCKEIVNHIDNQRKALDYKKERGELVCDEDYENIKITVQQVKEKYGGLRFYIYNGDEYVRGMIDFAESFSYKICESCGNPGKLKSEGWWRTLCDPCRSDDERKKAEWNENYARELQKIKEEQNA